MKYCLLAIVLLPLLGLSQDETPLHDSLAYYQRELYRLRKQADDSLKASAAWQQALTGIERHRRKSNDYGGFVLFSGVMHTNAEKFNQSITQSGFTPMGAYSPQFGVGVSFRIDRTIFDLYFISGAGDTKSTRGDETISAYVINGFEMDWGYNVFRTGAVALYPYLGFSYRSSGLDYHKPVVVNPAFTSIADMIVNDQTVELLSNRLGYQAGLGFDIVIAENKKQTSNKILFIKAGVNRPVWEDRYSSNGLTYKPGIKQGDWVITAGIKFGNKN